MKRCPTSLIIKEIQIKITVRCHITPIIIGTIKNKQTNKQKNHQKTTGVSKVTEKLELLYIVGKM